MILKQHTNALKQQQKNIKETRMEEESMNHGKDPHLLLVALTMMLITGPMTEIDYRSCVCG